MKSALSPQFSSLFPTAEAIVRLLHPYAEVVIHNIETQTIEGIFNSFSKREVGDESLLEKDHVFSDGPQVLGPYPKTNWDGRKLKSITSVIRDAQGKARFLMCINLDITAFDQVQSLIQPFLGERTENQPQSLFKDDWREKINSFIDQHLKKVGKVASTLNREEQLDLILKLYKEGAFQGKNAAEYIGHILGLSRATVYNYLKQKV